MEDFERSRKKLSGRYIVVSEYDDGYEMGGIYNNKKVACEICRVIAKEKADGSYIAVVRLSDIIRED